MLGCFWQLQAASSCCRVSGRERARGQSPGERRNPNTSRLTPTNAAEDGERALRQCFLPDDFAAELRLALELVGQLPRLLLGTGADDQVAPAPDHVVALGLELVCELLRFLVRFALDPHLPRRVAAIELLFLPRLVRRLIAPALLLGQPA